MVTICWIDDDLGKEFSFAEEFREKFDALIKGAPPNSYCLQSTPNTGVYMSWVKEHSTDRSYFWLVDLMLQGDQASLPKYWSGVTIVKQILDREHKAHVIVFSANIGQIETLPISIWRVEKNPDSLGNNLASIWKQVVLVSEVSDSNAVRTLGALPENDIPESHRGGWTFLVESNWSAIGSCSCPKQLLLKPREIKDLSYLVESNKGADTIWRSEADLDSLKSRICGDHKKLLKIEFKMPGEAVIVALRLEELIRRDSPESKELEYKSFLVLSTRKDHPKVNKTVDPVSLDKKTDLSARRDDVFRLCLAISAMAKLPDGGEIWCGVRDKKVGISTSTERFVGLWSFEVSEDVGLYLTLATPFLSYHFPNLPHDKINFAIIRRGTATFVRILVSNVERRSDTWFKFRKDEVVYSKVNREALRNHEEAEFYWVSAQRSETIQGDPSSRVEDLNSSV